MLLAILASSLMAPVTAELVTSVTAAQPGKAFLAAVVLRTEPNTHIYWANPGEVGTPTKVVWKLPAGWKAGELMWPVPSRFTEKQGSTFGYEGATMLMARITPATDAKVGPTSFSATVSWTTGPAQTNETKTLPRSLSISQKELSSQMWSERLKLAETGMPSALEGWSFTAEPIEGGFVLKSKPPEKIASWKGLPVFYPMDAGVIDHTWPQRLIDQEDGSFWIGLKRSAKLEKDPEVIRGLLIAPKGTTWKDMVDAILVEAPIKK